MKFIADSMLGKLAKWLRILGWDTIYYNRSEKDSMIKVANNENRMILTRDTRLQKKGDLKDLLFIKDNDPMAQLREVVNGLDLKIDPERIFSRCLRCNKRLEKVPPEEVEGKVPEYVWQHQRGYSRCPSCKRIYWKGTHADNILRRVKDLGIQ